MNRSPSLSSKPEVKSKFDPQSLRQWVLAFCIIRFSLPPLQSLHHSRFHLLLSIAKAPNSINSINGVSSGSSRSKSPYLYGYVFNRQRQDERLKRGGEQKSVVILSLNPYSSVFKPLLQILGPLYFDIGKRAFEHVASCVSMWPAPVLGRSVDLPIGNASLKVSLPPAHCLELDSGLLPVDELVVSSMAPVLPNNQSVPQGLFHDADIFGSFRGLLLELWLLWELLLIGEPILIIAPTPPQCCEAVASVVSLVAPLLCSVDFRPYFTIHDHDFAQLNSLHDGENFPPMVLGVTNLFFLKALRSIPHVVSVGSPSPNSTRLPITGGRSFGGVDGLRFQQLSLKRFSPTNLLNAVKLRRDGPLSLMTEHKEAIWTTYSAITKPDTSILNRLVDAGLSPRVEESMPSTPSEATSPFVDPPPLPPFNADEFLESLSGRGPGKFLSKRMKANWLDLYRRFLKGHNFMPWFQRRRAIAEQDQHRLWRQARMKTDIHQFLSRMSELEIVDSFNAIERHLLGEIQSQQLGKGTADSTVVCQKLKGDLRAVFTVLPKDMQELLLFNPQRAALLQGSLELTKLPGRPSVQVGAVSTSSPR
ncbi:hypothetical protein Syun_022587 [Stephania yunnanensis]|uniref:UDENN domain-containing protein n=1 Tax=Stephania yunnanensis TaxID=152371 RepID=A0AAP0I2V8_9MAGN